MRDSGLTGVTRAASPYFRASDDRQIPASSSSFSIRDRDKLVHGSVSLPTASIVSSNVVASDIDQAIQEAEALTLPLDSTEEEKCIAGSHNVEKLAEVESPQFHSVREEDGITVINTDDDFKNELKALKASVGGLSEWRRTLSEQQSRDKDSKKCRNFYHRADVNAIDLQTFKKDDHAFDQFPLRPVLKELLVESAFTDVQSSLAESSATTYQSTPSTVVPRVCAVLRFILWPITSDGEALSFFTIFTKSRLCSNACTKVDEFDPSKRAIWWNIFQQLPAAVGAFNAARNIPHVLADKGPRLKRHWVGFKKNAYHNPQCLKFTPKLQDIADFAFAAHTNWRKEVAIALGTKLGPGLPSPVLTDKRFLSASIVLQRAIVLILGFFGVRRSDELRRLRASNIFTVSSSIVYIYVESAKSDKFGAGHKAATPVIFSDIVRAWVKFSDNFHRFHLRQHWSCTSAPFFYAIGLNNIPTRGKPTGKDFIRQQISAALGHLKPAVTVGGISLRKAGSQFFTHWDQSRKLAYFQGGWRSACMLGSVCAPPEIVEIAQKVNHVSDLAFSKCKNLQVLSEIDEYMSKPSVVDLVKLASWVNSVALSHISSSDMRAAAPKLTESVGSSTAQRTKQLLVVSRQSCRPPRCNHGITLRAR